MHVFRVLDDAEILATLQHLPKFLDARPQVDRWMYMQGREPIPGAMRGMVLFRSPPYHTHATPPSDTHATTTRHTYIHTQVGLLVLDSLALPFRQDTYFQTEGPGNTARVVGLVARELCGMAQERALAVRGGVNQSSPIHPTPPRLIIYIPNIHLRLHAGGRHQPAHHEGRRRAVRLPSRPCLRVGRRRKWATPGAHARCVCLGLGREACVVTVSLSAEWRASCAFFQV